jgi:hypothetical protein
MRRRTDGYCIVTTKQGGSFHLRRDQYTPVRQAWIGGSRFVDAVGLHGDSDTIKLEDVDGVFDLAAENVAFVEEQRADSSDDSLAGGAV